MIARHTLSLLETQAGHAPAAGLRTAFV